MSGRGGRAELGLAALLVVVAVALELFWLRPQLDRRERLAERRNELRSLVPASVTGSSPAAAEATPDPDRNPKDRSAEEQDPKDRDPEAAPTGPVRVLAAAQQGSRLVQRELRRIGVQDRGVILETSYYVEVYGSFRDAYVFLNRLETGRALVVVDRFRMVTAVADPGVTLFLWATVPTESGTT